MTTYRPPKRPERSESDALAEAVNKRRLCAIGVASAYDFERIGRRLYRCTNPYDRSRSYQIETEARTCECMDFQTRGGLCKHMIALKLHLRKEQSKCQTS